MTDERSEVGPDPAAEATADTWVRETLAAEREAERPADGAAEERAEETIERQEDATGLNGIIGRIRAAFRRG